MRKPVDVNTWIRKEYFNFFSVCTEPFMSITGNVECTGAYRKAKEMGVSFFLYYMHKSMVAVNNIEEFHYRIEGGRPFYYDEIHGSTTVQNSVEQFAMAFLPYHAEWDKFYAEAQKSVEYSKKLTSMNMTDDNKRFDLIQYTTIPWISFTSVTNERNYNFGDSIPKIAFGKFFEQGDKLLMPMSVNVHHGTMDGLHVGKYFELFEKLLNE